MLADWYIPQVFKLIIARCDVVRTKTVQSFPSPKPIPLDTLLPLKPSAPVLRTENPLTPLVNNANIYMTVHINSFPYLLSPNDTLHLPFRLPDAPLGAVLRMTHVSRIGVRDFTLQGKPFIDEKAFTLRMRVIEHTKMPLTVTVKKKQRQRRARHLPNKQNYTVLKYALLFITANTRVCEMRVHDIDLRD